jgi:hypothetical protein
MKMQNENQAFASAQVLKTQEMLNSTEIHFYESVLLPKFSMDCVALNT